MELSSQKPPDVQKSARTVPAWLTVVLELLCPALYSDSRSLTAPVALFRGDVQSEWAEQTKSVPVKSLEAELLEAEAEPQASNASNPDVPTSGTPSFMCVQWT